MSLYPTKSIMQSETVQEVDELIEILQKFKTSGVNNIEVNVSSEDTDVSITDALVSVQLLERTLSDDSKIYDIKLKFSELEI